MKYLLISLFSLGVLVSNVAFAQGSDMAGQKPSAQPAMPPSTSTSDQQEKDRAEKAKADCNAMATEQERQDCLSKFATATPAPGGQPATSGAQPAMAPSTSTSDQQEKDRAEKAKADCSALTTEKERQECLVKFATESQAP